MSNGTCWMPLYVGDYLRDTGHLSTAEHGGYLLALMHAWGHGGLLPRDETRLQRICKMDAKQWAASRDTLLEFFYLTEDGYRQKRVERELERAQSIVDKRHDEREAATERMRRWRAKSDPDHPPDKPNGDATVTRHKPVTKPSLVPSRRPSRDASGDASVTRASQLPSPVQSLDSYLREGEETARARPSEIKAVTAGIASALKAWRPPYTPSRDFQLGALTVVRGLPQPQEPERTVEQQLAILRGEVAA
jgi:uncharacterized protein YdaU (DUF1376 family)